MKKIMILFTLFLLLVNLTACQKNTSHSWSLNDILGVESEKPEETEVTPTEEVLSSDRLYYDKLIEIQTNYGEPSIIQGSDMTALIGLAYAKLEDFNQDGQEELILVYTFGSEYNRLKYSLEIWTTEKGKLQKVYTGDCGYNMELYPSIKIARNQGETYVVQNISNIDEYTSALDREPLSPWAIGKAYLKYQNNEFTPAHFYVECEKEGGSFYQIFDDEDVSEENSNSENYNLWKNLSSNTDSIPLMDAPYDSYLDQTLSETETTLQTLRDRLHIEKETIPGADWKKAYISYVQECEISVDGNANYTENQYQYNLDDINQDGIPELMSDFLSLADGGSISTYDGNEIVTQHTYGALIYVPGSNLICDSSGHMDVYSDKIYQISDGHFIEIANGDYGAEDNTHVEVDIDGNPIYRYYWNDQEVDKDTYDSKLNELVDMQKAVDSYQSEYVSYIDVIFAIATYH